MRSIRDQSLVHASDAPDRFIESLSAKIHPTPPTADKLSSLFQDFYVLAASHIATYISVLASHEQRAVSPTPSKSSRSSSISRTGGRTLSASAKDRSLRSSDAWTSEQQMLTATELANRRRSRLQLDRKRQLLEEAVERRVCEAVYNRIWRHRSTDDEERDEKLRSRTAALAVIGIGLTELGVDVRPAHAGQQPVTEEDVRGWLDPAQDMLLRMNDEKHPLGKLLHLKSAHKSIVDALSRLHPSSSSADEILPTLIFTLINTRPAGINVISNLTFIQRFRATSRVDGEAAYCLTNLEAAISFLENVDIASLKADETFTENSKPCTTAPSSSSTERTMQPPVNTTSTISKHSPTPAAVDDDPLSEAPSLSILLSSPGQGGIHDPTQPSSSALGAASDAVLSRADQSFKTIGNTLEFSYNLLFGRLRERQLGGVAQGPDGTLIVPTTLDEARKLVSTPPPADPELNINLASWQLDGSSGKSNDRLLSFLGGSRMSRDRSSDSLKSAGSGKRIGSTEGQFPFKDQAGPIASNSGATADTSSAVTTSSVSPLGPAVESMRNLGSSLNPLNRFAGMNAMLSFGRSSSNTASHSHSSGAQLASSPEKAPKAGTGTGHEPSRPPSDTSPAAAATVGVNITPATKSITRSTVIAPPLRKFMEIENPGDLKISEVLELLRDYRRIAGVLKDLSIV